ncbi:uncharacterized protein LOC103518944 [Diaphorina citri]|uniref:Uncharacterized protein LOC103518944 n=1 Tax=Diaphorina citri TaxID=121845 RepID=A0A1S3DIB6_DIACI|nr:uncharacterized protein LOC103518944 [Diaphorina citri]
MSARIPSSRGPGQLNKDKVKILCQEIDKVNLFSQTPKTVTIEVGRTGFEVYKPRDSVWDSRSTSLGTNSDLLSKRKPSKASKDQQQQQHRKSSAFHPAPPVHHHHRDTKRRIPGRERKRNREAERKAKLSYISSERNKEAFI